MHTPTHIAVSVLSARNLKHRGKNGTNDAFVVLQLGGDRLKTSVQYKSQSPSWNETYEFELTSNKSELHFVVFHKSLLTDEFLGQFILALDELFESADNAEQARWFPLRGRAGTKNERKYRGELELKFEFLTRSQLLLPPAQQPERSSSLRLAKKPTIVVSKQAQKPITAQSRFDSMPNLQSVLVEQQPDLLSDPPMFEKMGNKKPSSLRRAGSVRRPLSEHLGPLDESSDVDCGHDESLPISSRRSTVDLLSNFYRNSNQLDTQTRGLARSATDLALEVLTKDELINLICEQRQVIQKREQRIKDLEAYVDHLVARVLEKQPDILQAPMLIAKFRY